MQQYSTIARRAAYLGVLTAIALVLGFIERYIPLNASIPGIKLGLANVVILFAMYLMNKRYALLILLAKVFLSGFLFAGASGLLYSLAGGLLSFLAMSLAFRFKRLSLVGVSVIGAIFHNVGQILAAGLVVHNLKIAYYLPLLLVSAIITGILTGIAAKLVAQALKKSGLTPLIDKGSPANNTE